jgi:large subunit ribosomal protein L17
MRHRKSGRKLGRNSSHRKAMFRNMVTSLITHGRLETTVAKAKELRPIAEKLVTLAKKNLANEDGTSSAARVAAIREAGKLVRGRDALNKLFSDVGAMFVDRAGGYTRIMRTRTRLGDNAEMAIIEFVGYAAEDFVDPYAFIDTAEDEGEAAQA